MFSPQEFFVWFAFIILLLQCYKDYKKRKIDSRLNFLMKGIVLTLVIGSTQDYWIYIAFLAIAFLFNFLVFKNFGEGDKEILLWVLPGLVLLGLFQPIIFLLILLALVLIETGIALKLTKEKIFFPGAILILISFAITVGLLWI